MGTLERKREPGGSPGLSLAGGNHGKQNHTTLHAAIEAHGLTPPEHIEPGKFHRFPGAEKRNGNRAGWCLMFDDAQGAVFGDWSTGLSECWQARKPADEAEQRRWRQQFEQARKKAEQERAQAHQKAAKTASDTWARAEPADSLHGYLVAKGIEPHGIRQQGDQLLIPLRDENGDIQTLQTIDGKGEKLFHPGGKVKGNHYLIGQPGEILVICEGYATGATIHETTGHPVALAMNCGNLKPVAERMRRKYPDCRIIVAADDDRTTEGNPGIKKAREAAKAIKAELATPGTEGDFNDLAQAQGAEAVRARFEHTEKTAPNLPMVKLGDLDQAKLPEPEHIIDRLLPVGVASSLAGHGGAGKSLLSMTIGACIASDRPFMGMAVQSVPVLIYSAEDGAEILRYRLAKISEAEGIQPAALAKRMHIIDATDIDPALFREKQIRDSEGLAKLGITTWAFDALADKAREVKARLVIIDNASDTFEANENERARVRAFIRALAWLARQINGAVLLLSHVDKNTAKAGTSSEGYSGSTAWHNSVRSRMFLHGDGRNLTLEHQKANLGEMAEPILMHWHHGTLSAGHAHGGQDPARDLMDTQHQREILQMIHDRQERGQSISTSRTAGNAWTVLSALDGFPKIDKRTFWRVMDKAETAGRLVRETYRTEDRKAKERFTVTASGLDWCEMIQAELDR